MITFQRGEFYYQSLGASTFVPILISLIAVLIAFSAFRFQILALLRNQLAEKAKECNKNIEEDTHRIKETPHNISHVVSTIITGKLLIDKVFESKFIFSIGDTRLSIIDQFYLQLHTSIIDYIIRNTITPAFEEGQVKYHIGLQLDYCNKLFAKSIERYGNATPEEIRHKLEKYIEQNKPLFAEKRDISIS